MSFAAPLWLAAAAIVGAGVLVAHLFTATVPPQDILPTARFIPEGTPLTVLRSRRVSDIWLLVLRLLVVALLGFALAGAHVARGAPRRVVVVDASRAVGSMESVVDSALAATEDGARIIVFDSIPRPITRDSVRSLARVNARGALSAAIVAAHRAVAAASEDRRHTELVVVSPFVREEVDSATTHLLSLWEGPVRLVRLAPASDSAAAPAELRAEGDDPVAAALSAMSRKGAPKNHALSATVRVVRTLPTPADSQWVESTGGALVLWPARGEAEALMSRSVPDSQGGVAAGGHVVIAQFTRRHQPRPGRVLARWTDGEPAATESALGRGCVREAAIPVDEIGDLALRDSFRGVVRTLLEPCGGDRDYRPALIDGAPRTDTKEARRSTLARSSTSPREQRSAGLLPLWLALAGAAALLAEQMLRSRRAV